MNTNAQTFVACADACGEDGTCNTFNYQGETSTCTVYDNANQYGAGGRILMQGMGSL